LYIWDDIALNADHRSEYEITARESSTAVMKHSCIGAVYISCELLMLYISSRYE
jgi:hypothetical protein